MKRVYYILLLGIIFLSMFACSEAGKEMFEGPNSICFRFPTTSEDIEEYRKLDSSLIFREDTVVIRLLLIWKQQNGRFVFLFK